MRYPQHLIDQVQALSVLDVAMRRMGSKLKKAGAKYKACCPFHNEDSPSFTITPAENIYKCFGCGRGGGVISFVQEYDGVGFVDAVKTLCDESGIPVEHENDGKTPEQRQEEKDERGRMYDLMEYAAQTYQMHLGDEQREKLYNRGVEEADIEAWRIGYAPDAWATIKSYAVNGGRLELAVKLDLVKQKTDKNGDVKYYDTFRDRIMLPICDEQGRVIAFGAWNWQGKPNDDGKVVKYVNSAETPLYQKSKTLYGMHRAKAAIAKSKTAATTEGYFDVIAAHRHGMHNTVAPCGTALTPEQLKWIRSKSCERVLLLQDMDKAGINARMQAIDAVMEVGMDPQVGLWNDQFKDLDDLSKAITIGIAE